MSKAAGRCMESSDSLGALNSLGALDSLDTSTRHHSLEVSEDIQCRRRQVGVHGVLRFPWILLIPLEPSDCLDT